MAKMPLPDYYNAKLVKKSQLDKWGTTELLQGYLIVNGDFEFPKEIKYPSIPCYVDKTTTVYPTKGVNCFLTGPEFLLARNQGCKFKISAAFYIPPKTQTIMGETEEEDIVDDTIKPFYGIIKDIQAKRREFPKGTVNNMLYKEMGNSIYGNVVRGMSNKKSFDSITRQNVKITATELSNPILAS
jgi:hypothetical protein